MRIVWDEHKRRINRHKHDCDFADLGEDRFEQTIIVPARDGRCKAIGRLSGRMIAVIFEPLGTEALAVVSMRAARRDERELLYDR